MTAESIVTAAVTPSSVTEYLIQNGGIYGVIILGLAFVIFVLWRDNKAKETQLQAKETIIQSLQEKRVTEAREVLTAINANTSAIGNMHQVFTSLLIRDRD